jgi:signal transduction histidine kinase
MKGPGSTTTAGGFPADQIRERLESQRYWHDDHNSPLEPPGAAVKSGNWLQWTVYLVGIICFTLLDIYIALGQWRALFFLAIAVLGTLALRTIVPEWVLGAVSLLGTVVIIASNDATGYATSFGLGESFILIILVITSFRRAPGLSGWIHVALVVSALLCLPLREWSSETVTFEILFVAATGCSLAAGAVLRNLDSERHLALAVATQSERDSLARDLHDDFTNRVTGMILMIQAIKRSPNTSRSDLDSELDRVEAAGAQALGSMRRWVATLRESNVELNPELGAIPFADISSLVAQWETTSLSGSAQFSDTASVSVPAEIQTVIYRIVQEAVTNVSRHAPTASWLKISITDHNDVLLVRVSNPLEKQLGGDPVPGSAGLGILGMRERATAIGGAVVAGPASLSTWSVTATIPLERAR